MDTNGLVSVIIPSYNRASSILQAVNSVLSQTYSNLELLVVDDGSTDDTRSVLSAVSDTRFRYIYQPNQGACAARNRGIREAIGDYIAFHDSDDIWHSDKLETQLTALCRESADLVICKMAMMKNGVCDRLIPRRLDEGPVSLSDDFFGVGTQTILCKTEVALKNAFDPAMPRYQDFEWLFRVLQTGKAYCVREPLVDYIIGEDSISKNPQKMFKALSLFFKKYGSYKKTCPLIFMHIVRNLAEGFVSTLKLGSFNPGFLKLMLMYYPGLFRYLRATGKHHSK